MNQKFYGNELAQQILSRAITHGKLNHAYLIYGENGLGKKTFATRFAMSVLCRDEPKPCFQCVPCKKILAQTHPDVQLHLGGEARGSVHIELIRGIRSDCVIRPNESEKKIYILTNAQNMTIGAMNAFLKTLEEPPKHAVFLLTAPNIDMLPQTVVSRLSPIQMFPLSDEQLLEALHELCPDTAEDLLLQAARLSRGNLGQALERLSSEEFAAMQKDVLELCRTLLSKREYPMLRVLSSYEKDKPKLGLLLKNTNGVLRGALLEKLHAADGGAPEKALAAGLTHVQLMELIEFFEQAQQKLASNANMNLLLAYFCAQIKQRIG